MMQTEGSGREPRHVYSRTPAVRRVSAPGVLTDYPGASRPVRFRRRVYVSVWFLMSCLLAVAWLLLHYNHA